MCGIAGQIGAPIGQDTIAELHQRMAGRGPDQNGYWSDAVCTLVHARLAVIDLEGGVQPMSLGDKVIVYNGEIYNSSEVRAELAAHGFAGKLLLCGDHEIALAGAMQTPGCVLIAGTGSVCYGKNAAGEAFRCGGGGHIIDDPGSGYMLGRDALAAALRTEDGRLSENALHAAVMDAVGGHDIQGIFDFVYFSRRGKSDIAALAPLVLRCAEQGDAVSLAILRRGATELARLVSAVTGRLGLDKKSPCALAGGLLAENNIYRRTVCEALAPFCRPAKPEHGALFGAVQLALAAVK